MVNDQRSVSAAAVAPWGPRREDEIIFYGAMWCGDSRRSQALLDRLEVPYTFVDVDEDDDAAAWVRAHNRGYRSTPTIVLGQTGRVLVEPSTRELTAALRDSGLVVDV